MKGSKSTESASHLSDKKYIFPQMLRKYYTVGGLASFGLLMFAFFMLAIGIKQEHDKIPCFIVSGVFGMLYVGTLSIWIRNYRLMAATYYVDNGIVFNCVEKMLPIVSVDLSTAIRKDYTHSFFVAKSAFDVDFVIFSSNGQFESVVNEAKGISIYKTTRKLWASGAVMVPKLSWESSKM